MAKVETIFCAIAWGLMNMMLITVAFEYAAPAEQAQQRPTAADAPAARA